MKNLKKIFFLILITNIQTLYAQTEDSLSSNWSKYRNIFSSINKSKIETKLLAEYSWHTDAINGYDGQHDSVLNLNIWENLYNQVENMKIYTNEKGVPFDSIKNRALKYINQGINPILILDYKYNTFHDSAYSWNLIDTIDGKLVDVPEKTISPYLEKRLFAACSYTFSMGISRYIKIRVPSELYFGNNIKALNSLKINTGSGWIYIQPDVTYTFDLGNPEAINTPVLFQVGYTDTESSIGNPVSLTDGFKVGIVNDLLLLGKDFHWNTIMSDIEWQGKKAEGVIVYRFGKGNSSGCYKKPLIFVDGVDFGYKIDPNWEGCVDGKCNTLGFIDIYTGIDHNRESAEKNGKPLPEFQKGHELFDGFYNLGYDVIFLDFKAGADYIQRNSMLLVKLIQDINNHKCSKEELVVCGASMGGQVVRYALTYMENNNMKHCVRNSMYFDSPHKGANIPIGMQMFIEYFAIHNYGGLFNDLNDALNRKLNRPATKQLLTKHVSSGFTRDACWEHFDFYNELKSMGSFAKDIRKVAVPSGSCWGNKLDFADGSELVDLSIPVNFQQAASLKKGLGILVSPLLIINSIHTGGAIKGKFYATAGRKPDDYLLFKGDAYGRGNTTKFKGDVNYPRVDNAPGGTNDALDMFNQSASITKHITLNASVASKDFACFIPTNSSLCLQSNDLNYNVGSEIFYDQPAPAKYPFDAYYSHSKNEIHVQMTNTDGYDEGNVEWTLKEIQRTQNIISELPKLYTYIDSNNNSLQTKKCNTFNFGNHFRHILNDIVVNNFGLLSVNKFLPVNYGLKDDFFNSTKNVFENQTFELYTSDCGSEVIINEGGVFELGDVNGPNNNKAIVRFRDGSNLYIEKGSKLIIHNGSKLIVEPGATLYIKDDNAIVLDGENASIEIQGKLIMENGVNLNINNGFIFFNSDKNGVSKAELDIIKGSKINLVGNSNEKRLQLGKSVVLDLPKGVDFNATNATIEVDENASISTHSKVYIDLVDFKSINGANKNTALVLNEQTASDVSISNCNFTGFYTAILVNRNTNIDKLNLVGINMLKCHAGLVLNKSGVVMSNSSFVTCATALNCIETEKSSELSHCSFSYCNSTIQMGLKENVDVLLSWINIYKSGLSSIVSKNTSTPTVTIRCSNFTKTDFYFEGIKLNMSTIESHPGNSSSSTYGIGIHGGKNIFKECQLSFKNLTDWKIKEGKNDFITSNTTLVYCVGSIISSASNTVDIDQNHFSTWGNGNVLDISYINVTTNQTQQANLKGNININEYGGCSGSGGSDGDGLVPVFVDCNNTNSIDIYPNPANNYITIQNSNESIQNITIFDLLGRKIYTTYLSDNDLRKEIDISTLKAGNYIITIVDSNGISINKKVVVVH
jgi:hypothetical protein